MGEEPNVPRRCKLGRSDLIGIRKFQSITPVGTNFISITLASKICVKTNIRRPVHRNYKREVANGIVLEAPTGNMTFSPNLVRKSSVAFD